MLKDLIHRLTGKGTGPAVRKEPRFLLGDGYYWQFDEVPNGCGGYRAVNVWLLKVDDPNFARCIVDENGRFCRFPGVKKTGWERDLKFPLDGQIRFGFWISGFEEGLASVRWTLQPDGRYYEDEDGFGAEDDVDITLYADLDHEGRFTGPFATR